MNNPLDKLATCIKTETAILLVVGELVIVIVLTKPNSIASACPTKAIGTLWCLFCKQRQPPYYIIDCHCSHNNDSSTNIPINKLKKSLKEKRTFSDEDGAYRWQRKGVSLPKKCYPSSPG